MKNRKCKILFNYCYDSQTEENYTKYSYCAPYKYNITKTD